MDYTTRPQNNLQPGDFNLGLLVELYGTPYQPLTEPPDASATMAPSGTAGGSPNNGGASWWPPAPPKDQQQQRPDKNDEDEKEDKKDKKEKEDDRLRRRRQWRHLAAEDVETFYDSALQGLQERYESEVQAREETCKKDYCVYDLDETFKIVVNKLLVAE